MISKLNNAHSLLVSVARLGLGLTVSEYCRRNPPRPEMPLELYQYEGCPFCRKVREAMSRLDLAYISRSSAKGAGANRYFVSARAGKTQFPFLVDPNTGTELYESEAIIDYLAETYGGGRSGLSKTVAPLSTLNSALAGGLRPRGLSSRLKKPRDAQPEQLLELYNFESSPYCRKVREVLDELELDALIQNVAKGSKRRPELVKRGGQMMVPFLVDPNTGRQLYESDDIVAYLRATYKGG